MAGRKVKETYTIDQVRILRILAPLELYEWLDVETIRIEGKVDYAWVGIELYGRFGADGNIDPVRTAQLEEQHKRKSLLSLGLVRHKCVLKCGMRYHMFQITGTGIEEFNKIPAERVEKSLHKRISKKPQATPQVS